MRNTGLTLLIARFTFLFHVLIRDAIDVDHAAPIKCFLIHPNCRNVGRVLRTGGTMMILIEARQGQRQAPVQADNWPKLHDALPQ